jgi:8-oxo-dGTP pyrophosphatase MutT (NUDIX family)
VEKHKKLSIPKLGNTNFHSQYEITHRRTSHYSKQETIACLQSQQTVLLFAGGKIDMDETTSEALYREISEELNVAIEEHELTYYTHITAPAYGEETGTIMEQECFLLNRAVNPAASAEVSELKYFCLIEYLSQSNQAPEAVMILEHLQANHLID